MVIGRIPNVDSRRVPPRLSTVEEMADKLLAERIGAKIGVKCA